jgi:hypothetical protein
MMQRISLPRMRPVNHQQHHPPTIKQWEQGQPADMSNTIEPPIQFDELTANAVIHRSYANAGHYRKMSRKPAA